MCKCKIFCVFFVALWFFSHTVSASNSYGHKIWSISRDGEVKGYLLGTAELTRKGVWKDVFGLENVFRNKIQRLVLDFREDEVVASGEKFLRSKYKNFASLADERLRQDIADQFGGQVDDDMSLLALYNLLSFYYYGLDVNKVAFGFQLGREAVKMGMSVHSLDTVEGLVKVGDSFPVVEYERQLRYLLFAISQKIISEIDMERDYWLGYLSQNVLEDPKRKKYNEYFITQRSKNWLPKITDEYLEAGEVLIAVNESHLYSQSGLIKLLEGKGYTLVPLELQTLSSDLFSSLFSAFSSACVDFRESATFVLEWLLLSCDDTAKWLSIWFGGGRREL